MKQVSVSCSRRSGFTLLEVMVALALLMGALLAVAQLLVAAARAAGLSRDLTIATCLAAQKMEQLRGLAWGYDIDGGPIDDAESDVARWPDAATGGTGLTRSPPGSLGSNIAGFADYLDEAGRWLGSGPAPPPGTVFVRRWSTEADAGASPPSTLTLHVVVLRQGQPSPSRTVERTWTEMAHVLSARARRPT